MKINAGTLSLLNLTILVLLLVQLVSCEKDKFSGDVVSDPQLVSELRSRSVDTLSFKSYKYIIETELCRDFFPGGPINKKSPLIASIYLVNIDSLPVSKELEIKKLYVIKNQQIWIASLSDGVQQYVPVFKLEKLNNNGPEWDTGIFVDIIIEIQSIVTTERFFLISRNRCIERVE